MSDTSKRPDVDAIRARVEAHPGWTPDALEYDDDFDEMGTKSWSFPVYIDGVCEFTDTEESAALLIAHAPTDIKELLAHVEALEAAHAEAARLLEAFTSTAGVPYLEMEGHESTCRYCHRAWRGMAETHADECPVAQARAWLAQYG